MTPTRYKIMLGFDDGYSVVARNDGDAKMLATELFPSLAVRLILTAPDGRKCTRDCGGKWSEWK